MRTETLRAVLAAWEKTRTVERVWRADGGPVPEWAEWVLVEDGEFAEMRRVVRS